MILVSCPEVYSVKHSSGNDRYKNVGPFLLVLGLQDQWQPIREDQLAIRTNDCWLPGETGPRTNRRGPTILCLSFQFSVADPWPPDPSIRGISTKFCQSIIEMAARGRRWRNSFPPLSLAEIFRSGCSRQMAQFPCRPRARNFIPPRQRIPTSFSKWLPEEKKS